MRRPGVESLQRVAAIDNQQRTIVGRLHWHDAPMRPQRFAIGWIEHVGLRGQIFHGRGIDTPTCGFHGGDTVLGVESPRDRLETEAAGGSGVVGRGVVAHLAFWFACWG